MGHVNGRQQFHKMEDLKELLSEFIEWARDCGEDAFFIFEESNEAINRFLEYRSFTEGIE